ncbi:LLM class flavin-dependent oxidoreductase [Leucobacter weissii]|uniref:LLM class flavin-dependent oxidoreductase n=1 Tax=Leucobacter weissii TaxID=1983706 RepID=A0A939MII1_9MICO|nr:LLM class flavin-dependent oxidoreductase [Leucobacter weissii]MBO1901358.1 LLM class flavin-dependent oxidoreductase [Leucobacter weissii]
MSTKFLWYLKAIDGRFPWDPNGRYDGSLSQLQSAAQTFDRLGFYGVLHGTSSGDPLISVSSLIGVTERLRFLVPIYPGLTNPRLLAQQALTFDKLSGGRLLFNLVNGQDAQLRNFGVRTPKDERYRLSSEYWRIVTAFYEGGSVDYAGTYLDEHARPGEPDDGIVHLGGASGLEPGGFVGAPVSADAAIGEPYGPFQTPHVPLWGAGGSPAGIEYAGRTVEVYLAFLTQHFDRIAKQVADAQRAAARNGRAFEGVGLHGSVIVRRTRRQALDAFYEGFESLGAEAFAEVTNRRLQELTGGVSDLRTFTAPDAKRQSWIDALLSGRLPTIEELELRPGVYAGVTEFIGIIDVFGEGGSTYLVGSGEEVATQLVAFKRDIPGVDRFIFSGWPLVQEAQHVADHLFPYIDDLEQ